MSRRLLTPKWLLAHLLVVMLVAGFVFLGLWQLGRHQERVELNETTRARLAEPALFLEDFLRAGDLEQIEFRRVIVAGTFRPLEEVLVRSQIHLGSAGFHVITPLELASAPGSGVLVNRGWVPLTLDSVPVQLAEPPEGETRVEGWIRLSQERPPAGAQDADGRLTIFNRVNVERIQEQVALDLVPFYLVMVGERGVLPEALREPAFEDDGPHLAYAVQWFGFAVVGLVGYFFLARRGITRGSPRA